MILDQRTAGLLREHALNAATERGEKVAVAIADAGGHLLSFHRMDGVGAAAAEVVAGKARTAATYGLPTAALDALCRERPGFLTVGAVAVEGGVPIMGPNGVLGAVAVGGAAPETDAAIAQAALGALD